MSPSFQLSAFQGTFWHMRDNVRDLVLSGLLHCQQRRSDGIKERCRSCSTHLPCSLQGFPCRSRGRRRGTSQRGDICYIARRYCPGGHYRKILSALETVRERELSFLGKTRIETRHYRKTSIAAIHEARIRPRRS